jgi:hypothetical protein
MRGNTGESVEVALGSEAFALPAASAGGALIRAGAELGAPWVLIVDQAAHATVNGEPVPTAIRVLDSRDEIRCGQTAAVFTDEHLARIEPFPGAVSGLRRVQLPVSSATNQRRFGLARGHRAIRGTRRPVGVGQLSVTQSAQQVRLLKERRQVLECRQRLGALSPKLGILGLEPLIIGDYVVDKGHDLAH